MNLFGMVVRLFSCSVVQLFSFSSLLLIRPDISGRVLASICLWIAAVLLVNVNKNPDGLRRDNLL
jgi:hypothetical protein